MSDFDDYDDARWKLLYEYMHAYRDGYARAIRDFQHLDTDEDRSIDELLDADVESIREGAYLGDLAFHQYEAATTPFDTLLADHFDSSGGSA